jgi:hypothetical protein
MPSKGGAAGKAGDQYEALWTVDATLRVIDGRAEYVTYESLDPEASPGVEFHLQTATGEVEFWSLKRQTTAAAGWTLAILVKVDERGRSILSDLVSHVERDNRNVAVFASTLGAAKLEELRSVAATADMLKQRLDQSVELKSDYDKYFLPLFSGDKDRAREFLKRLQIRTADEISLRTQIESTISLLFYNEKGGTIDAASVRRLLAEYLLDHMHEQIDRKMLLDHLAAHRIRRKDWKVDTTVSEKVGAMCDAYATPLREQLIGGALQTLPGAEKLLGSDGLPIARRTLISGGAGGGKSTESAHVIERLRAAGIPTLPIRLDVIDESVLTPHRLGEALSLPASPVAVLAGLADGGNCVLVIDQLDAVSLASGRRAEVWSLFERILTEADGYPNLRVIVACRAFDLEHDHRMRSLKAKSSAFEVVTIASFDPKTVDGILGDRQVHAKLKPLLVVPLHLAMFLSVTREDSERLETRDQLFAAFWTEKQRRTSQRLGRTCDFADVVDRLSRWLSEHQELSAPAFVIDDVRADADALTSEHVLVLMDGRYRFFHETFFDYAFARRFAQTGGHLLDLLLSSEQYLFRRAQVRQVLSFLRSNDAARYLNELRSVLADGRVRFHIKSVAFQYLTAIVDPTQSEWVVLHDLAVAPPDLLGHVNRVISNHAGWFDALDAAGFLDSELSSNDTQKEERMIWFGAMPEIMEKRSARVAALLVKHRRDDETWRRYLQYICRNGHVFHSPEMFDLFLSLIRDGTLDGTRPGFAVNDDWWSGLYSMSEKAPAMTARTIAVWFDRKLETWNQAHPGSESRHNQIEPQDKEDVESEGPNPAAYLWQHLDADGGAHDVVSKAADVPLPFVEQLLPRVAKFVAEHPRCCRDRLDVDPLWSFRSYGDNGYQVHDSILKGLARALESLARSMPDKLDGLLDPYVVWPHETIAYLVLRAWTAAPATYAERLARYLAEDPRRLKIGYASWGGDSAGAGMASDYRSIEAVRAASRNCSPEALAALETAIVNLRDEWESRHPKIRGRRQLQLLTAMDQNRLGSIGRAKLAELRAKFPDVTHDPPEAMKAVFVGSPIPAEAQEKMTDAHWLEAMAKYAGVEHRRNRDFKASGGEYELARSLELKTKADPRRFVALSVNMPTNLPAVYFEAIIRGVAATAPPDGSKAPAVSLLDVVAFVERAHALAGHPCGRWIAHLVEKWSKLEWPLSIIEMVAWYATDDPDPVEEVWRERAPSGQFYNDGDPDISGLNSTRGAAANAIARLLFEPREPPRVLIAAVDHLAHDQSVAVRSQGVYALLALLNTRRDLAIRWFVECVSIDPVLLKTRLIENFVHNAGLRDYLAIRVILRKMIASDEMKTVEAGARLCCLLALGIEPAKCDAEQVRAGLTLPRWRIPAYLPTKSRRLITWFRGVLQRRHKVGREGASTRREAAATIYATNVAHEEVGRACRELLLPFFVDAEDAVRAKAATAFRHISALDTSQQSKLLLAFLDATPGQTALVPVIRALEDSPVRLPDLVCRLVEAGIKAFKTDASNIRTQGAMIASDLSKIVIRLYTQSDDAMIKKRCLDAIDAMEEAGFFGLSDELARIDR